jgi:hypothetical protein
LILGVAQALEEVPCARVRRPGALDEQVVLGLDQAVLGEVVEDQPYYQAGDGGDPDERNEDPGLEAQRR